MSFAGLNVLITGSASGLGAATARQIARDGARLIINYSSSKNEAEEVAEQCRKAGAKEVLVVQGNVAHPEITLITGFQHGVRIAVPGSQTRMDLPLFVAVRDNGPGIPEDILPHLFEPFVTSKSTGSGLGLSLVAKIIGDHGGLIEVNSRPGRTEFRVHLPVVTEKDADQ